MSELYNIEGQTNGELPLWAFQKLIGLHFHIPAQQRGYKWTENNVKKLLNDLRIFIENGKTKDIYCLQPLAVVKCEERMWSVLDGQQRLTTLFMLYYYLFGETPYDFKYDRDDDVIAEESSRVEFLYNIATHSNEEAQSNIDFYFMHNAYKTISTWKYWTEALKEKFKALMSPSSSNGSDTCNLQKSIQIIWYEVDHKKRHETFRNLNSGKIPLNNTELIKSLFLNRVSGLAGDKRSEVASQFEDMEQQLNDDHFWYMYNSEDVRRGRTRMDMIFNLVAGVTADAYDINPRKSFEDYFESDANLTLEEKWKRVRHTYLRLYDLYKNPVTYHYIGFLTYSNRHNTLNSVKRLLDKSRKLNHSELIMDLKDQIKLKVNKDGLQTVGSYRYNDSSAEQLRLLYLLHNIETIIQRYETLKTMRKLRYQYEKFPFDLLHKQKWDIEHIASHTDNDFKNADERKIWLDSIKADLGDKYNDIDVNKLEKEYLKEENKQIFDNLYKKIIIYNDSLTANSIKDEDENGKDKNQVGNLTLLDSHTNRSYHNALFPRKRHYVIVADGLKDDVEKIRVESVYIPPCTRQVFTKAYNKGANVSLNTWTQQDADAYRMDMEKKLAYYFNKK